MRTNLIQNDRRGKKPAPRVAPVKKTRARRRRKPVRCGEDLEMAGAPSLKHRSVWAYLVDHAERVCSVPCNVSSPH